MVILLNNYLNWWDSFPTYTNKQHCRIWGSKNCWDTSPSSMCDFLVGCRWALSVTRSTKGLLFNRKSFQTCYFSIEISWFYTLRLLSLETREKISGQILAFDFETSFDWNQYWNFEVASMEFFNFKINSLDFFDIEWGMFPKTYVNSLMAI